VRSVLDTGRVDRAVEFEQFFGDRAVADPVTLWVRVRELLDQADAEEYIEVTANGLANDARMLRELGNGELAFGRPVEQRVDEQWNALLSSEVEPAARVFEPCSFRLVLCR
jgi:hypothetical protein